MAALRSARVLCSARVPLVQRCCVHLGQIRGFASPIKCKVGWCCEERSGGGPEGAKLVEKGQLGLGKAMLINLTGDLWVDSAKTSQTPTKVF